MVKKILITRRVPDAVIERARRDYDVTSNDADAVWSKEDVLRQAEGCDGIILTATEPVDRDFVERLPKSVKVLTTYSVGADLIDTDACKDHGIAVGNTPDVLNDATADTAMLCLLGAARMAQSAEAVLRGGQWDRWAPTGMLGVHVTGKRLGIIGMGRIGRAMADRARGFDMEIHYHNRRRLSPELEKGATYYETADTLLPQCDFLSFNCPLTDETKGFLNAERIEALPQGAVVVNTARGPVVEDEALIAALRSGRIAAAGLDVFTGEPQFNKAYLDLPNAFLLPHIGSATIETRNDMGFCCLDNLDAFFAGTEMPGQVV